MINPKFEIKDVKKFKILQDKNFLKEFPEIFGKEFTDQWQKLSRSNTYWRLGARRQPPVQDKLTNRTGRLRTSLTEKGQEAIKIITISGAKLKMVLGSKVPYAARQEWQLNRKRSYVGKALMAMRAMVEKVKKKALKKYNG